MKWVYECLFDALHDQVVCFNKRAVQVVDDVVVDSKPRLTNHIQSDQREFVNHLSVQAFFRLTVQLGQKYIRAFIKVTHEIT